MVWFGKKKNVKKDPAHDIEQVVELQKVINREQRAENIVKRNNHIIGVNNLAPDIKAAFGIGRR